MDSHFETVMDSTLANYYEKVDWGEGVDEEEDMTFTKYITKTVCTVNMYGVEVVVAGVGGRNPTWR